jgi:FkbM family methyltransferase
MLIKAIKHSIFVFITNLFKALPFNNKIAILLKSIGVGKHKIYKDLRFSGIFQVDFLYNQKPHKINMIHYGGYIENETFWKGLFKTFESESGMIWIDFAAQSEVIFDIGANTGIYSLVAKSVNPSSKIYAFEPSRNTFSKLSRNFSINSFDDILKYQIALGENDGKQVFYDSPIENQTSASLSPDKNKNWDLFQGEIWEYEVETNRLDTFISQNDISKIDLIKLDVEMYEPQVLEGFVKYIEIFTPVLFIEVLTDKIADQIYPVICNKYKIYQLLEGSQLREVTSFVIVLDVWNYLLIPIDKVNDYELILEKYRLKE